MVLSAGNHDYIKKDSYYRTFEWPEHVHMILSGELACVDLAEIDTAVYGFSYYSKELREKPYEQKSGFSGRGTEILMIHGGDEKHVPVRKEEIEALGYSYVALGHIHKPQVVLPDRMAWCGSLEPTDRNDTGRHGYISGEIREGVCHIQFVPFARREYVHASVQVDSGMSGYELKEKIRKFIGQRGNENIYRIILHGYHDPDVCFDLSSFDTYGNIIEITDATKPAYNYEKILRDNRDNIVGKLIEQWKDCEENSVEYRAMCEGVRALMETRRG